MHDWNAIWSWILLIPVAYPGFGGGAAALGYGDTPDPLERHKNQCIKCT